ncbi:hypothetical protein NKI39_14670 [Mesorhizobium sp. M0664]|uniref:hypothetical protein n=1 Tax=Mesorhizobium sp. M0664 TaxID=2956982 RepID=UPI0033357972
MSAAQSSVPRETIMFGKIVFCLIGILASSWPATAQSRTPFKLFESLIFTGDAPDLGRLGFEHLTIADPHVLGLDVPNAEQVQKALELPRSNQHLVVDIEQWPLEGAYAARASSIAKYQATLGAIRKADPSLKLGLYGVLPMRDYWNAIGWRGDDALRDWKSRNGEIASALVPYVDELFPSLYTFYGDKDAWVVFARANIEEARRISQGKPVYCFLWPQFFKTFAYLPGDYWYTQLDTCRRYADGIVIWGTMTREASNRPEQWDENSEWWQATLRFLRELGKIP